MLKIAKQISKPSDDLFSYNILLAGPKKIGKTSLISACPDHHIFEGEPGNASHLECSFTDIHNWAEAEEMLVFLQENPNFCKTIGIDDIPSFYQYCVKHKMAELGKKHSSDLGYKGWEDAKNTFEKWCRGINRLPMGKIYTTHVQVVTGKSIVNEEITQLETTMSNQCREVLNSFIHVTGFIMPNKDGSRYLQISSDGYVMASNGFSKHFLDAKTGKQIMKIPLGFSEKEGYKLLTQCWENKLSVAKSVEKPKNEPIDLTKGLV